MALFSAVGDVIANKLFLPRCDLCHEKIKKWDDIKSRRGKSFHKKCFKDRDR